MARRWATGAVLLTLATGLGCGASSLRLTSLETLVIDPPGTQVVDLPVTEAVWWVEDDGRVSVALHWRRDAWIATDRREMVAVISTTPAFRGVAANLQPDALGLRLAVRVGDVQHLITGVQGVLGVKREGDRLTGSLRVLGRHRRFDPILSAWSLPAPYLVLGQLDARLDPDRGADLRAEVEQVEESLRQTLESRPPASQPTTQPADPTRVGPADLNEAMGWGDGL